MNEKGVGGNTQNQEGPNEMFEMTEGAFQIL